MNSPILNALNEGYKTYQILDKYGKKFNKTFQIKEALNHGYQPDRILDKINKREYGNDLGLPTSAWQAGQIKSGRVKKKPRQSDIMDPLFTALIARVGGAALGAAVGGAVGGPGGAAMGAGALSNAFGEAYNQYKDHVDSGGDLSFGEFISRAGQVASKGVTGAAAGSMLYQLSQSLPNLANNPFISQILGLNPKQAGTQQGQQQAQQAQQGNIPQPPPSPFNQPNAPLNQPNVQQKPQQTQTQSQQPPSPSTQSQVSAQVRQNTGLPIGQLSTQSPATPSTEMPQQLQQAQTQTEIQPSQPQETSDLSSIIDNLGIGDKVKEFAQSERGSDVESIIGKLKYNPSTKDAVKKIPYEQLKPAIESFIQKNQLKPKETRKETNLILNKKGEVKEVESQIGPVIKTIDGQYINEKDIENEPEEIRSLDLEEPVTEYLSRIPEGQKSSVIDVSLFDPETNELQIRFPNGDQWIYGPVPEEIFEKINSMTGIPVSSGESKLRGTIWDTGVANSAGADFYKLIKKFVKEGKIKERKLKKGIDLFKGFSNVKKRK